MSQEIQWCFETVNGTKNRLNTVHRSYRVSLNPLMKHSKNDLYDSIVSDFKSVLSLHSDKRVISVDVRYDICEVRYSIGSTQVAQ